MCVYAENNGQSVTMSEGTSKVDEMQSLSQLSHLYVHAILSYK